MNTTHWKLYLNSDDAWKAMKEACLNARKTIDIEQYILERDDIGSDFFKIVAEKRELGVRVRILCDMAGSYGLFSSPLKEALRDIGIEIRFFNVIKPWRIHTFFSWFFRDHRKIMIVDQSIGFVGGVGIRSDFRNWRDSHLKVTGPITAEIQHAFNEMWNLSDERGLIKRLRKTRTFSKGFQFLTNSPFLRKRFFYQEFVNALRNAKETIFLTTPYFIPDRRIRRILRLAAKRGVDVRILVPEHSNHPWADTASHGYYEKMLASGVRIFHYKGEMLHAKTAVIDSSWATVGSFNLDSLSILYNYEANIVSNKSEFGQEMEGYFLKDIHNAHEVSLSEWQQRNKKEKWKEFLSLPIRRFL